MHTYNIGMEAHVAMHFGLYVAIAKRLSITFSIFARVQTIRFGEGVNPVVCFKNVDHNHTHLANQYLYSTLFG